MVVGNFNSNVMKTAAVETIKEEVAFRFYKCVNLQ